MFKSWSHDPNHRAFTGVKESYEKLPAGLYRLATDPYGNPRAIQQELRDDHILMFENGIMRSVLGEIASFWDSAGRYKDFGVSHKRGILLYGPPGCGKTGIASAATKLLIDNKGIAIQMGDVEDFAAALPLLKQIEEARPVLVLVDDIEQHTEHCEEELLEIMDGVTTPGNGILYLATTNNLGGVPDRVKNRPSRIDTLIEVGFPDLEQRKEYLRFLITAGGTTRINESRGVLERWSRATEGFSLAHLKELVLGVLVYGRPEREVIERLRTPVTQTETKPEATSKKTESECPSELDLASI